MSNYRWFTDSVIYDEATMRAMSTLVGTPTPEVNKSLEIKAPEIDLLRKEVYSLTNRCSKYEKIIDSLVEDINSNKKLLTYLSDMMDEEFNKGGK